MTDTTRLETTRQDETVRRGYGSYWKGLLPELGYLLPNLPVAIVSLVVLVTLFATGAGMIAIVVGVPLIVATLWVARGFGVLELVRLRGALFPALPQPDWSRTTRGRSSFSAFFAPLLDSHYWLYLLHGAIVNPIVGIVTWSLTFTWLTVGLAGITYPLLSRIESERNIGITTLLERLPIPAWVDIPATAGVSAIVLGVVFMVTLPFVTHGLTWVHHAMAKAMLARFRSESLEERVAEIDASRTAVVVAEGAALRRLERDIHDGPQQRLVRLQMDLAAAERQLAKDPDAARELISGAMQQSREALEELRALSRGFAPPILVDRGLVAALESLAVRSPVPTHVEPMLPEGVVIPAEWERNAYFFAAEALTNVAKHANARNAWLRLELHEVPTGSALAVIVSDDGQGGAQPTPGHGLEGLGDRVRGLGGTVEVSSPLGGPTILIARLPLPASATAALHAPASTS